jgi:hypothetical protein
MTLRTEIRRGDRPRDWLHSKRTSRPNFHTWELNIPFFPSFYLSPHISPFLPSSLTFFHSFVISSHQHFRKKRTVYSSDFNNVCSKTYRSGLRRLIPETVYTVVTKSLGQRSQTGGPRAISGSRPLVTRPTQLFVSLLLRSTSSFIVLTPKALQKYRNFCLVSCFKYCTSTTHATGFGALL